MEKAIDNEMTFFKENELQKLHEDAKKMSIKQVNRNSRNIRYVEILNDSPFNQFESKPKMGGVKLIDKYRQLLEQDAAKEFKLYIDLNQKKKQEYSVCITMSQFFSISFSLYSSQIVFDSSII